MNITSLAQRAPARRNEAPRPPSLFIAAILDEVSNERSPAMGARLIGDKFASIGARVELHEIRSPCSLDNSRITVNIRHDRRGEYFDLAWNARRPSILRVLDVQPKERHLLLMVDDAPEVPPSRRAGEQKFLCGHDERHWFVAAVPEMSAETQARAMRPVTFFD